MGLFPVFSEGSPSAGPESSLRVMAAHERSLAVAVLQMEA